MRERFRTAFGLSGESVDHLVGTTRKALSQALERLDAALAAGDAKGVSHWAHNLQGGLLNAGFDELAAVAFEIERAAGGGADLAPRLAAVRAGLAEFLASP